MENLTTISATPVYYIRTVTEDDEITPQHKRMFERTQDPYRVCAEPRKKYIFGKIYT